MIFALLWVTLFASSTFAQGTVQLSPQSVVDRILATGFEKQEAELQRQVDALGYYQAAGQFDFGLEAETSYESKELEPLSPFENEKQETYRFKTTLQKPFSYGTTARLKYSRESIDQELNPFLQNANALSTTTIDFLTFEIEQNLMQNFLGGVKRRRLEMQKLMEQNRDSQLLEKMEELIVTGLRHFWDSYSAHERLKAALETRDRYSKLVATTRNKRRLGFAAPGEVARVEAEFEQKDQTVKRLSSEYLQRLDALFRLLAVETPEKVEFDVGADAIPAPPQKTPVKLEGLRVIQAAARAVEARELYKKAIDSEQTPVLNIVGSAAYRGADENASEAFSDLGGFNSPTYYVGLKFQTYLGSASEQGAKQEASASLQLEKIREKKTQMEIQDILEQTERDVVAFYQIAQSSIKAVDLRKSALREIEVAYGQGRLDVSQVIDAFNFLLNAETDKTIAIGNYRFARNQLASLRDELIAEFTQGQPTKK